MSHPVSTRRMRDNKRKCPLCAREFSKTEHLERHVRSHTKEKPFECLQCGRKYSRHDSLLRHTKDQHNGAAELNGGRRTSSTFPPLSSPGVSSNTPGNLNNQPTFGEYAAGSGPYAGDGIQPSSQPEQETWPSNYSQELLLGGDFNLGLDTWVTTENLDGFLHNWDFPLDDADLLLPTNPPGHGNTKKPVTDLQPFWYTHLDNDDQAVSGYATPIPRQKEVDDNYRQTLHRRLQIRPLDQNLPSADFLNLCVRSYFKRFHRLFPVVHAPTFRPTKSNSVLLLSICSIGSLLTGHPNAVQRGTQLFERLNKAILDHWEQLMRRGPEDMLAMIQAALLGQTFGLLSGQSKHMALVDAFHGTVISWARRAKLFQSHHSPSSDHQDLDTRWKTWVRTEEKIRVALGLRIHDAEMANLLHHEPLLPSASRLSHAGSDALFFAATAPEWMSLYTENMAQPATPSSDGFLGRGISEVLGQRLLSIPGNCYFTIYTALQDISSAIIEARINDSLSLGFTNEIEQSLMTFYRQHLHEPRFEPLRVGGKILWHYLFMSLHSDIDLLERSIGRDGAELSISELARIQDWANSAAAKRCVAHAIMIYRTLEAFSLTSEPALHMPRIMFSSAICILCFEKYECGTSDFAATSPELQLLHVEVQSLVKEAKSSSTEVGVGPLWSLVDLLQRIGHWGISRTFASILEVVLQAECV